MATLFFFLPEGPSLSCLRLENSTFFGTAGQLAGTVGQACGMAAALSSWCDKRLSKRELRGFTSKTEAMEWLLKLEPA